MDNLFQEEIFTNNDSLNNRNVFMLENGEIFNINKNEDNKEENKDIVNFSFGDINNKNVFNSLNTGATVDVNSQDVNFDFSFLSSEKKWTKK